MPELGGPGVHEQNGVCQLVVGSEVEGIARARDLLGLLPSRLGEAPPLAGPLPSLPGDPAAVVPSEARRVYDIRDVARHLVDGGDLLELDRRWARNMVTALARLEGRP